MHDRIVRNIRLLGSQGWQPADLAFDQGRFSAIGNVSEAGREVIDGRGSLCFPGGVDLHVHFNEPGRTHWEGFANGSLAAAAAPICLSTCRQWGEPGTTVNRGRPGAVSVNSD